MTDGLCLKGKKILLATGGSGGHVSPALAVAETLKTIGATVTLSFDERTESLFEGYEETFTLCALPLKRRKAGVLGTLLFLKQLVLAFLKAFKLSKTMKPDLIIGFGGAASAPVILTAMIRGMPLVIHEQNAVLGQVNRWAARSALFIGTSFSETREIPPKDQYKVVLVGNPVKSGFYAHPTAPYEAPEEEGPIRLLVVGGSQGSAFFDETVSRALTLLPEALKSRLHITQQVRQENQERVKTLYKEQGLSFTLERYFEDLPERLKKSHFVIGRSGSSTVFELLALCRPGLLIPLKTSKDNHQLFNAQAFQETGAGLFVEQNALTAERLSKTVLSILLYPHLMLRMYECCLKHRQVRAADRFAKTICDVMRSETEAA